MTRRQLCSRVGIGLLFLLALLGWGWAFYLDQELRYLRFKYSSEVSDVADLLGQYASARSQTGHWPEPNKPYGTFFHLRNSAQSKGGAD